MMDYRKLLKKYMNHVIDSEGTDFIDSAINIDSPGWDLPKEEGEMTKEDAHELIKISQE
jgi:hypothetical protein